MEPGSAVWIMKPSLTNQGAGISIIDSCAGLRAALEAAPDLREWVVQRCVERPLLVQGRKFHIRAYALCVGEVGADSLTAQWPFSCRGSDRGDLCLYTPDVLPSEAAPRSGTPSTAVCLLTTGVRSEQYIDFRFRTQGACRCTFTATC